MFWMLLLGLLLAGRTELFSQLEQGTRRNRAPESERQWSTQDASHKQLGAREAPKQTRKPNLQKEVGKALYLKIKEN